jgi:hypothetical protein
MVLMNSDLKEFDGRIFIFEDSDVIALLKKNPARLTQAKEKLKQEFTACGMIDLISFNEMSEQLAGLVRLAEEKRQSAKLFHQRQQAVDIAETIFTKKQADPELTRAILKKRPCPRTIRPIARF